MPAIADRVVWEKVTKRRAGTRWDSVVEKVWKYIGGNEADILSIEKFGVYKTDVREMIKGWERLPLRNQMKKEEYLEIYGGLREEMRMKTYLHGPMDYAKKLVL